MASHVNDNYTVLLREKKLPLSLLEDPDKAAQKGGKGARADLLAVEPFSDTFGKGAQRKRPKLRAEDYSEMVQKAEEQQVSGAGSCRTTPHPFAMHPARLPRPCARLENLSGPASP